MKKSRIRSTVCDYIDRNSFERATLRATLDQIASTIPETVIFGGMLRDFAYGSARSFSSDIDLVSNSSKRDIFKAVASFNPIQNRFGGYRFISGRRSFDIWALEDTWALREGLVKFDGFDSLLSTTFFGADAAIFYLNNRDYQCNQHHLKAVSERVLDLNLQENPNPHGMVLRAIRLALKHDLAISTKLARYMVRHWSTEASEWVGNSFARELEMHICKGEEIGFRFWRQGTVAHAGGINHHENSF